MNDVMAERIRMIIDTDEEVRLGVKLAASALGMSPSEAVNAAIRKVYAQFVQDAKKYIPKKNRGE